MVDRIQFVALIVGVLMVQALLVPGEARSRPAETPGVVAVPACPDLPYCTPSFWAWELALAAYQDREADARAIAQHLIGLQKRDGRWSIGSPWIKAKVDFKKRTRRDAESWEVAEVSMILLRHHAQFGDPAARAAARRGADYLRERVVRVGRGRYLPHMPECNNLLQPHSTYAAAALLHQFTKYRELAGQLRRSAKKMEWRRIMPKPGRTDLRRWQWGPRINDYEKIQSGWYLSQLGDPTGRRILNRYAPQQQVDHRLAQSYAVMIDLLQGKLRRARVRADGINLLPQKGYDAAMRSWLAAVSP